MKLVAPKTYQNKNKTCRNSNALHLRNSKNIYQTEVDVDLINLNV